MRRPLPMLFAIVPLFVQAQSAPPIAPGPAFRYL